MREAEQPYFTEKKWTFRLGWRVGICKERTSLCIETISFCFPESVDLWVRILEFCLDRIFIHLANGAEAFKHTSVDEVVHIVICVKILRVVAMDWPKTFMQFPGRVIHEQILDLCLCQIELWQSTNADCRPLRRRKIRRWLSRNNLAFNLEVPRLEAIAIRSKDATRGSWTYY